MNSKTQQRSTSIVEIYNKFILSNLETVDLLETSLRALLFLIPGRFKDSELKLELAYAATGVVSLYHDLVVLRYLQSVIKPEDGGDKGLPPAWTTNIAKWIAFIHHIEIVVEIYSKQTWGKKGKWTAIAIVEVIKMFLKFIIINKNSGSSLLVNNYHANIPHYDSNSVKNLLMGHIAERNASDQKKSVERENDPNRIKVSKDKWQKFKSQSSKSNNGGFDPSTQSQTTKNTKLIADVVHTIRPIIYLSGIYSFGRKSWKSLGLSFVTDLVAIYQSIKISNSTSPLEKDEMLRRIQLLLLYMVRSPAFEFIFVNNRIMKTFSGIIKMLPLGTGLTDLIWEYVNIYRSRYFYISGS